MTHDDLLYLSERWFRLLLLLYPADFRDRMGTGVVEAYGDRARVTLNRSGALGLARLWLRALADALWNGLGERLRPAASWRRGGDWGRDLELVRRRLFRSPIFAAATLTTLTVGLGAFAVVYTAVDKILIERMPYREPDNLYFVWRDQAASGGLKRDWLAGPDVADLQNAQGVIEGAVGLQLSAPTLSVRPDGEPLQILMMLTSPQLFELLGVARSRVCRTRSRAESSFGHRIEPCHLETSRRGSVDHWFAGLAQWFALHRHRCHGSAFSIRSTFKPGAAART
jgi:hypothetical protein